MSIATMNTMSWDSLQMGGDGKLSLQMGGGNGKQNQQVTLQVRADGKVQAVGADGKVNGIFDIVTVVDPNDPTMKAIGKYAASKNGLHFERVILGIKVSVLLAVYCLILKANDGKNSHTYFTAVFHSPFTRVVLFFARVPLVGLRRT